MLDVHVHLELPFCGTVSADDYRTGTRAGARGGVTTVIDFAIPYAGDSLNDAADNWMKKAEGKSLIDYTFHICITRWNEHKDQIEGMVKRGFTTFKEFMIYESEGWQSDDRALYGTLEKMQEYGTMLLVHAESSRVLDELIARHHTPELMKQYGARLHPMTRPNFVEAEAIQRVVQWCEATGGQALHRPHVHRRRRRHHPRGAGARRAGDRRDVRAVPRARRLGVRARGRPSLRVLPAAQEAEGRGASVGGPEGRRGLRHLDGHVHVHARAEGDVGGRLDEDPDGHAGSRDAAAADVHARRARRPAVARGDVHEAEHESGDASWDSRPRKGSIAIGADADLAIIHPTRDAHGRSDDDGDERGLVAVRGMGSGGVRADDVCRAAR